MPRNKRYTRNLGRREVEPLPPRRPDAKYIRFRCVTRLPGKLCSEDDVQIAVQAYRDA